MRRPDRYKCLGGIVGDKLSWKTNVSNFIKNVRSNMRKWKSYGFWKYYFTLLLDATPSCLVCWGNIIAIQDRHKVNKFLVVGRGHNNINKIWQASKLTAPSLTHLNLTHYLPSFIQDAIQKDNFIMYRACAWIQIDILLVSCPNSPFLCKLFNWCFPISNGSTNTYRILFVTETINVNWFEMESWNWI